MVDPGVQSSLVVETKVSGHHCGWIQVSDCHHGGDPGVRASPWVVPSVWVSPWWGPRCLGVTVVGTQVSRHHHGWSQVSGCHLGEDLNVRS